jgi:hypothetical protein
MSTAPADVKQRRSRKQNKRAQLSLFEIVVTKEQSPASPTQKLSIEPVKKLEEFNQTKPEEMNLFEFLGPADRKYSNTIELYDFIPKYFWGKSERINDRFLESLERTFECRGARYKVVISPARIKDRDGIFKDYYPSQREEIIEDALRKLACEGQGLFLDDIAGVTFTLYQLEQELKRMGHGYNKAEIKDALSVCVGTTIDIRTEDGNVVLQSHIFENVGLQTFENWQGTGKKTRCFVRFNNLVTNSIKNKTFRQLNYEKSMSYRSVIARQFHKRMSHHYIQASLGNTYEILLSTVIRDFGLTACERIKDNLCKVELALNEMKDKEVVLGYKIEKIIDVKRKSKLMDAKLVITPHPKFVADTIKANKRSGEIKVYSVPLQR